LVVAIMASVAACGSDEPARDASIDPAERAVTIETTACGDASRTKGSGIVVGDARVLTAAHVVVGAGSVVVHSPGGIVDARLVHLDVTRDLAVLDVPRVGVAPVVLADFEADDEVTIVGRSSSGLIKAVVRRPVLMDVDDVRGTERHRRDGYELDAAISGGDSGSGVFDSTGRLGGIVFAEPTGRESTTFVVGATEVAVALDAEERPYECRPALSRVIDVGSEAT
jgi:S1-C subfamily serine protease